MVTTSSCYYVLWDVWCARGEAQLTFDSRIVRVARGAARADHVTVVAAVRWRSDQVSARLSSNSVRRVHTQTWETVSPQQTHQVDMWIQRERQLKSHWLFKARDKWVDHSTQEMLSAISLLQSQLKGDTICQRSRFYLCWRIKFLNPGKYFFRLFLWAQCVCGAHARVGYKVLQHGYLVDSIRYRSTDEQTTNGSEGWSSGLSISDGMGMPCQSEWQTHKREMMADRLTDGQNCIY